MSTTLAIDPGAKSFGWAFFSEGFLTDCGFATGPTLRDLYTEARNVWHEVGCVLPFTLVVEVPEVYSQRAWKGDPNDLIEVALGAGVIAGVWIKHASTIKTPQPKKWKGQVPKPIHNKRVIRELTDHELLVFSRCKVTPSKRHNVIDAIGLGLWSVGRL